MDNIAWCVDRGISMVIGTTGFTPERLDEVRALLADRPEVGVLIASNFSIGAVLMMQFAEKAARFYPSARIIELHHPNKASTPSGISATTALGSLPDGRRPALRAGPRRHGARRRRPRRGRPDIHIHGVRLQGLVAHQEVLFGDTGETLTVRTTRSTGSPSPRA